MGMVLAELAKLRRSALWIVAVVLPLLAVITGTVNYAGNVEALSSGWASYWSQVVLFYGMVFMSMGVAVAASAAWRMEHRGHNWNLLMATPARAFSVVGAKLASLALVVVTMQFVLLGLVVLSGKLVLGLDGWLPWHSAAAALLGVVAALPVAALQSLLSMLVRSFAAPVALGLLGCVAGVGLLYSGEGGVVSYLLPQSLVTTSLSLGSTAVSDAGSLDLPTAFSVVLAAAATTLALWALSATVLSRRDVR
ncbi:MULTISPECIES: ABC transporter permease [Nocardiopsis]|uniref:ABC transporter permease n=1 Tax=Nocardiopsis TaxID=2013 RepID=UPI00037386C4|nr:MULTISPECIES: ABC transporter permease [Nocardiopsis]ASU60377.1 ABC transporter permease [Nocardiopsis dassonvillei]